MFDSASGYERSFDEWMPYGMPDAVQSDSGFDGFVKGPIEAHNREMQFAGDQIGNFLTASNAYRNAETDKEIAEMLKPEEKSSGGGGGGVFGTIAKTVAGIGGTAIGGPAVGALASAGVGASGIFG